MSGLADQIADCQRILAVTNDPLATADELDRLNAQTLALVAEISGLRRELAEARGLLRRWQVWDSNDEPSDFPGPDTDAFLTPADQPDAAIPPELWELPGCKSRALCSATQCCQEDCASDKSSSEQK